MTLPFSFWSFIPSAKLMALNVGSEKRFNPWTQVMTENATTIHKPIISACLVKYQLQTEATCLNMKLFCTEDNK